MVVTCLLGFVMGMRLSGRADDEQFGARVRGYIMAHPEIVRDAAEKLRLAPLRAAIETPFAGAWAGNPHGDVTMVVFTDYYCPHCRAVSPTIDRLLARDPKLRLVWREMPILGPGSAIAAAAALAAARQGKYYPFHRALFSGRRPDDAGIAAAAEAAGLIPTSLAADSKAPEIGREIQTNLAIARALSVEGTPFFVIGNRAYQGEIGYDRLAQAVADARSDAR